MSSRLALIYALTAGFMFVVTLGYATNIGAVYTVDAFLIPKEQTGTTQTSGLATATRLLGLDGAAGQSTNFDKFQKYWASRDIAEQLTARYPDLMRRLFSSDWDAGNNRWYDRPHNLRQYLAIPFNILFGIYPVYAPSSENLAMYIKTGMKLDTDVAGSEVHIAYRNADAKFAQWFLRTVISQTDQAVRDAERKRDQDFVIFSRDRLQHETNVEYRQALTDSVRQFEISNMYAQAGDNFSFQYVEAPDLPINRSAPKPLTYAVFAFIFSNLVGALVAGGLLIWPASGFSRIANRLFDGLFGIIRRTTKASGQRRTI
jgi:hypothetical protein